MKRPLVCLVALTLAVLPVFGGLFSKADAVAEGGTTPAALSSGRLEGGGLCKRGGSGGRLFAGDEGKRRGGNAFHLCH